MAVNSETEKNTVLLRAIVFLLDACKQLQEDHLIAVTEASMKEPVTGLYNKFAFKVHLLEIVQRWLGEEISGFVLLSLDLNLLKRANDKHGHRVGDELILGISRIIESAAFTEAHRAYRIGGDEFALILPSYYDDYQYGVMVSQRVKEKIVADGKDFKGKHSDRAISVSIGSVSCGPGRRVDGNNFLALGLNKWERNQLTQKMGIDVGKLVDVLNSQFHPRRPIRAEDPELIAEIISELADLRLYSEKRIHPDRSLSNKINHIVAKTMRSLSPFNRRSSTN